MKKILLIIICFLTLPNVAFASVVVMDMDTTRVLYKENENEKKLIASTTKIMTSMVVINNCDIKKEITVDERVLKSHGSGIYIEVGEIISIEDLLYGLMMRSGNDAALVLANEIGGSEEGFAELMNELAWSIGMKDTFFVNASGLDDSGEGNVSTAYDMALLMSYAMKSDIFKTITGTKHKVVKTNYKTYDWYNKNKLLFNYEYTTGGKTGYTKKAYRTLVTTASKDGKNLVVVTLNEHNDFEVHEALYNEYFKKYKLVNIIDAKTFLKNDDLYVKNNFNMLLKDKEIDDVKTEVIYTNDVSDRIGYVKVSLNNKTYFSEDIYLIKETKKKSLWYKIKRFFKNLFSF